VGAFDALLFVAVILFLSGFLAGIGVGIGGAVPLVEGDGIVLDLQKRGVALVVRGHGSSCAALPDFDADIEDWRSGMSGFHLCPDVSTVLPVVGDNVDGGFAEDSRFAFAFHAIAEEFEILGAQGAIGLVLVDSALTFEKGFVRDHGCGTGNIVCAAFRFAAVPRGVKLIRY
jgi:hypothetical protein